MPPRFVNEATLLEREHELLDAALKIISQVGLVGLTMDKLVAGVGYSKGTVYNHFSSKEDVFAGLCNRNMKNVASLFVRAVAIPTLTFREHMTALGFAYMLSILMAPENLTLLMQSKTDMFEKASKARQEEHERIDAELFGIVQSVIHSAVVEQELSLESVGMTIDEVTFAFWATTFGTVGLLLNGARRCSITHALELENRVISNGQLIMNGLGWRQASRDVDELLLYLKTKVFKTEVDELSQKGFTL